MQDAVIKDSRRQDKPLTGEYVFCSPDLFDSRWLMPVDESAPLDSSLVKHACACDSSCPHT